MAEQNIYKSTLPDIEIPDISLTEYVFGFLDDIDPTKTVNVDGLSEDKRSYTFGQYRAMISKVAAGLHAQGFEQGNVMCIYSPNVLEYGIIFHAVAMLGGVNTTANPLYKVDEITHQIQDSNACAIFTIPLFLENAQAAAANTDKDIKIFVLGEAEGAIPFSSLLENDGTVPDVTINPKEDAVALPYSSGTTGLPKGVVLTHHNLVANLAQIDVIEGPCLTGDDVFVGVLPFYHIYGMQVILNYALIKGITTVVMSRFDFGAFLTLVQTFKISVLHIVPPIILALAKHPVVANFDLSSVQVVFSGAAPLGEEIEHAVTARFADVIVKQAYGMTETSPASHINPTRNVKSGTVGLLMPNMEAKIIDIESGELLGVGVSGELCVRGPNIMKEYLNRAEATESTIIDGWLHTGDLAMVDEDGYFTITDRLKELIKYKGFQVPPAELEALLLTHPDIADAAVIGVPDLEAGELPKAFVVPKPDSGLTEEAVAEWVSEKVAPHKRLRGGVVFREEIPKSKSGKILRRLLRDEEASNQ
eukprot:TRINITY_DN872_c4_g1_i1.p1 TRINITY_DN872_c4_g1~~TRINITY_DN872_c4_g1_i1.p1  ORF type:complete len:545 (+),score=158.57 TRINITY_DN872_c4_g1_i1:42-1637(+)